MAGGANTKAIIEAFVDVLIPGDGDFPAASVVRTHDLVVERIIEHRGNDTLNSIIGVLESGLPFRESPRDAQIQAVRELERSTELFRFLLRVTYLSYYQSPLVIEAIKRLGFDYNLAPQPNGYSLALFDPRVDLPSETRGTYIATEQVRRVDLSGLDLEIKK